MKDGAEPPAPGVPSINPSASADAEGLIEGTPGAGGSAPSFMMDPVTARNAQRQNDTTRLPTQHTSR